MKKTLIFISLMVLGASILSAQTKIISGTITSAVSGEGPIPGVTVQVKGTTLGALSDANGRYKIDVPMTNTTLVFSYIGMKKQEIEIAGRVLIDVVMEYDIQALEEVVVTTGYGIKRAPKSSSSLNQVVSGEKLNEVRPTNFVYALAGKVAGVQFRGQSSAKLNNSGPYVRLRGGSGLVASPKVIYVVDGTVLSNITDINLDDIDNVNVLSGPSATAILGSQAANGAIIITTKKARVSGGRSMGVELNSGLLLSSVYILPKYQNDYAGGNTYDMYKYTYKETDPIEWKTLDGKYYPNYSDDASWGPRMAGQEYIPWYAWYPGTKYTGKTASLIPQPDNARDFYDIGMTWNNSVAFNKVGEDYNIRVLIGNITTRGNLPGTSLDKTSFSLKSSYNITKKLTISANVNFFTAITNGWFNDAGGSLNYSTGSFNQYFHRDLDMNILKELKDLRSPVGTLASWNHFDPTSYDTKNQSYFYSGNWWINFYSYSDQIKNSNRSDRLFGDVSLNYKIINGLDFKLTYRRQENNTWGETSLSSDLDESIINSFDLPGYGYYESSIAYSNRENYETLLSFSKKLGNFSINANAGSDFFKNLSRSNYGGTLNNGFKVRNLFSISNSNGQPQLQFDESLEKYRAVFIRSDIGYRDFIFGEFTLRNDWFSALPPDNNSILSKSFGGSFVFSELLKSSWLSFGKLRASWGEIPTAIDAYVYPGFSYLVDQYKWNNNFLMTTPDKLVDPRIQGDTKTQREIGLDLRFMDNRYGINLTYWDGSEKNIPCKVTIAGYSGFTSKYMNTGKITKQGLDIALNLKALNMLNLKWEVNSTFSWLIKNEVVEIAEGVDRYVMQSLWGSDYPILVHAKGYPWGQLFGSGMKMFNGKPELNPDGSYVADPNKYFGSILPKITGGLQNSFKILKNITLVANIDYQFGGKFWSASELSGTYSGITAWTSGLNDKGFPIRDPVKDGGGVHVVGVDGTTHEDADYYIDAYTYFHNFIDQKIFDPFIYDLTYIKFRELSIGYDIPVEKIGNMKNFLQSANISFVVQNFWLIYADTYDFDPAEVTYVDGETGQFPSFRSFGMNLKINF